MLQAIEEHVVFVLLSGSKIGGKTNERPRYKKMNYSNTVLI